MGAIKLNQSGHSLVVFTVALFHSAKSETIFCIGSNTARSVLDICDGENLLQCSRLEIRLNTLCWSTIMDLRQWSGVETPIQWGVIF